MFEVLTDAELERRTLQVAREYEDVLGEPTASDLDRWARMARGEITIEEAEVELRAEMQAEKRRLDG